MINILQNALNAGRHNILFFIPINNVVSVAEPNVLDCLDQLGYKNKVVFDAGFYNTVQRVIYEENGNGALEPEPCAEWYFSSDIIEKLKAPDTVLIIEYSERMTSPDARKHIEKLIRNRMVTVPTGRNITSEVKFDNIKMVIALSEKDDCVFPMNQELLSAFDEVENL